MGSRDIEEAVLQAALDRCFNGCYGAGRGAPEAARTQACTRACAHACTPEVRLEAGCRHIRVRRVRRLRKQTGHAWLHRRWHRGGLACCTPTWHMCRVDDAARRASDRIGRWHRGLDDTRKTRRCCSRSIMARLRLCRKRTRYRTCRTRRSDGTACLALCGSIFSRCGAAGSGRAHNAGGAKFFAQSSQFTVDWPLRARSWTKLGPVACCPRMDPVA